MRTRPILSLLPFTLLCACTEPAPPPPNVPPTKSPSATASTKQEDAKATEKPQYQGKPRLGTFGIDTDGADTGIKAGADFYNHAGGKWMKSQQIPADRSRWGTFDALRDEADANVRKILDAEALKKAEKGSDTQKAADYYTTYLDTKSIDEKGFAPAKPTLDAINKAKTLVDIVKLMGKPEIPTSSPIATSVSLDQKNPDRYIVAITQSGLGLPEREYYLKKDKQFEEIRAKYQTHLEKVLVMVGDKKAAANAKAIFELETKIAEVHWTIAERRERDKTYNPKTLAELEKDAPKFPWKTLFETMGYEKEKTFVVRELSAIPKLADLFGQTPVATWKAYLAYHFLRRSADVLPSSLDNEIFDFTGRILNGQPQQRDRWKRAVSAVNGAVGDAVGQIYVASYFQPKAKTEMDKLVENLRKGYEKRIQQVDWMTAETKKVAFEKLAAFRPKIGYPKKWKSYAGLDIKAGDAFGNARRAEVFRHEYMRDKLGKPSDRDEWFMTPQTVNAYYSAPFNEIVFPAAILQPPFFDPEADPAVNYGGIGGVIGHEMGHGFDDQGSKSDAKGILRTWWAQADIDAFKKRTDALADQYSTFEPLPGIKVNGRLTLGENIGDIGGLTVAYEAYKLSLEGKPAEVLNGFTGEQRFFLGWAQVWRSLYRDEALRNQVLTDPHSPAMFRVNGVVRNVDAWYQAFNVAPSDPLYLAPEKRVRIW